MHFADLPAHQITIIAYPITCRAGYGIGGSGIFGGDLTGFSSLLIFGQFPTMGGQQGSVLGGQQGSVLEYTSVLEAPLFAERFAAITIERLQADFASGVTFSWMVKPFRF